jgi:DNA-binding IscR family transcriptional regulator
LKSALGQALDAYLNTLEAYTLKDLIRPRSQLVQVLGMTA